MIDVDNHLNVVTTYVYDRNVQEGRNRFFAAYCTNHDPRTIDNPTNLTLWEQSPTLGEATLLYTGPWNRLMRHLDLIPLGQTV